MGLRRCLATTKPADHPIPQFADLCLQSQRSFGVRRKMFAPIVCRFCPSGDHIFDLALEGEAGAGGHEVRAWLAAAAALAAAGPYRAQRLYYRPIDPWIAGFGVVTAQPA